MIRVITVVKMLWTHEAKPSESKSTYHAKPHVHSICFLPQYQLQRKCCFFFRARAEKGIAREQRGMDSYRQCQISQSDCEICCNCGKNIFLPWCRNKN